MTQKDADHVVTWEPQEGPQTAFVHCPVPEIFFGGARGGGKTDSALGKMLIRCLQFGKGERGIFFRRTYKQLEEVMLRAQELFPPHGAKWREKDLTWTFPNGAWIKFGYLERDSDAQNHQGKSYTVICIEEAGTFPSYEPIAKLKATLRSAKGIPTQLLLTGNPGGPGANWIRARYIDPAPQGWEPIKETQVRMLPNGEKHEYTTERIYIPSRVTDNQILMQKDPNYIARLMESGSEQLVRAWLEGDFFAIDGAFFDNFDRRKHVMPTTDLPEWWTRYRACDWGSARPFCVLWFAVASEDWVHPVTGQFVPKDALIAYNEWYGVRYKKSGEVDANKGLRLYAEEVARGILERERRQRIDFGVIDPSAFAVDGGPSIAERMFRSTNGKVAFRRADNKRVGKLGAMSGWDQVRARLSGEVVHRQGGKEQTPMLFFFDSCKHTLRTLPMMQHDEANPEDMCSEGEDHACFAAGTLIETSDGPRPIEKLVGQEFNVQSVGGYVRAKGVLTRKRAEVWRYTFSDGTTIDCTPDHKFTCADGKLRTIDSALRLGYNLLSLPNGSERTLWTRSLFRKPFKSLTVKGITSAGAIFSARARGCIELCGSGTTARSRTACTSTTSITTAATTQLKTSIFSPFKSTLAGSMERKAVFARPSISTKQSRLRRHGIQVKKVASGIEGITKGLSRLFTQSMRELVLNVGSHTNQGVALRNHFAQTSASRAGAEKADSMTWSDIARFVVARLLSISTASRRTALARAVAKLDGASSLAVLSAERLPDQPVYCISAPATGLFFFKNGLLARQCDTVRYACMARPYARETPTDEKPMTTLEDVTLDQLWYDQANSFKGGRDVTPRI